MSRRLRIALVRGPFLNEFECQSYAPLADACDITAFTSRRRLHNVDRIPFRVVELPEGRRCPERLRRVVALVGDLAARARFGEGRYLPGLVPRLRDFDVVHAVETCHGFSGQAVMAKRRFGCRLVVTAWENIPFNRKRYSRYAFETIRRQVLAEADAFLAVTERARDVLLLEGAEPERVRVIPMGVDLERFRPAVGSHGLRRSLGLSEEGAIVLSVGAMSYAKGLTFLLHAVARARQDAELSAVRFSLVLVGRDVGGARREIARLGLGDIATIVPYVPYSEMPVLYNLASVLVLASLPTPTWQEQFGMALVEGLASGTPVLTTLSGSIPEVVGDAAVLVPPADHVALYRGLKGLLLDSARRQQLSQAGRQRAEALFDRHTVAKQIRALYESLG